MIGELKKSKITENNVKFYFYFYVKKELYNIIYLFIYLFFFTYIEFGLGIEPNPHFVKLLSKTI